MNETQKMTICLWFDKQGEEAANFYTSIFKNSSIGSISRYSKQGFEFHGMPEGTALVVSFKLNDMNFSALNGGPRYKFNESMSIVVSCDTQEEIDHYWNSLTADGGQESQCGWLKDKYGISWQIIPSILGSLMSDPTKASCVTMAFMQMKKMDIETLINA
jgi:predicted 3-demethylubiquinone-9 3-methyltransferase (glyoxalase superfamily)